MRFCFLLVSILFVSLSSSAQLHKSSVNLFKQQTKAIQNALPVECPEVASGDQTNAFTQNVNHPCLNSAASKASP